MEDDFVVPLIIALVAGVATIGAGFAASRSEHRGLKTLVLLNEAINGISEPAERGDLESARTELVRSVADSLLAGRRIEKAWRLGWALMMGGLAGVALGLVAAVVAASGDGQTMDPAGAVTAGVLFVAGIVATGAGEVIVAVTSVRRLLRGRRLRREAKAAEG